MQLSAFGYDAAVISPTTSVTTDSAGKATAEVQATTKGTSRLGYRGPTTRPSTGPGASTAPSTQRVVRPKVILEASYAVPFTADQKKRFSVKVVNEDDTTELLNGVELQIVGPATNPYYEIDWVVFVHGETSTSGNITVGGLGHFELNSKGQISGQGPSFTIKVKNGTAGDSAFVVVQPPGT